MVYYIYHSAFVIELKKSILIFDFYRFPSNKKKEKENLPNIIKAEDLELEFPKNEYLEKKETDRVENAILKGGVATGDGKCFVGLSQLSKVIVSDKAAAARVYNNADEKYKLENSKEKFLEMEVLFFENQARGNK